MNTIKFLGIGLGCSLLLWSCSSKTVEVASTENSLEEKVKTMKVAPEEIQRVFEYPSTVKAWEEIHLAPASPGRIEEIMVEVSDIVKKGQPLVQMDRTQLLQTQLQMENLALEYKRAEVLYKAGSYSEQAFEQLKTQYNVAKTNVEYLEENTLLLSPFAGIVSGKYFEDGEMYSGSPIQSVGKAAVVSLVEIDRLKSMLSIPESYFPLLKTGMKAQLESNTYPGEKFEAEVNIIYPVIDPVTRTFQVELKVDNPDQKLRPGMFVRIKLDLGKDQALVVPDYAVLKMQGSNERYVFVEENGVARRIVVTLGNRFNDKVEVISDELKEGMNLVVVGQGRLLNGAKLNVLN